MAFSFQHKFREERVIPEWVANGHYFVFMNYMSLESKITRKEINNWIDLIFGINQQSKDHNNLFKPLTDEVLYIKNDRILLIRDY